MTDSIAAVEAAWSRVAREIGADPAFVIAATHGKRAIDNLARFKPRLHPDELSAAVEEFERSILFYADAHANANTHARLRAAAGSSTPSLSDAGSCSGPGSSAGSSCVSSLVQSAAVSTEQLVIVSGPQAELADELAIALTAAAAVEKGCVTSREGAGEWEWELEAAGFDRAVRVLPGVKTLLASIPEGRYAVATSGAKTYGAPPLFPRSSWADQILIFRPAHGCLSRVGIVPPKVTITADDPRLRAGKPAPDPFLLAAKCLGYSAERCVVFEDSPSGIRAGVAAGAIVVAVCTSHSRRQVEECGAHYVVENLEDVHCEEIETDEGTRLMFTVEH